MLNLIFAPSADLLVSLAGRKIREAWTDPFIPPPIIVPNPAVGKWLSTRLIEGPSFGCIANARLLTLERFLWNALEPDTNMVLIGAGHLTQVICALLDEKILADAIYRPLKNYLCPSGGNQIDTRKRVQLSAKIAQQFLEYEYNRPSVWNEERAEWGRRGADAQWLLGKNYSKFDGLEHEAWQKELYRKVYGRFSKSEAPRYITLPHLYRYRREERGKEKRPWCDVGPNTRIILFGVSKISHFHRNTLVEISQIGGVDMHVFLTNPCAEFWEDVDTSRRPAPRRRWSSDSSDDLAGIKPVKPDDYDKPKLDMFADEQDHALLKLWGSAGKENIFLWCPQAQWNFEYYCRTAENSGPDIPLADDTYSALYDIRPDTLLASIQKSLLLRKNGLELPAGGFQNDRSLQILACPDMSREVEELRESILDLAREKKIGRFGDAAVYMPDPNKYLPYIQRVFGAYPPYHHEYIPFSVLGAPCGSSMIARGFFTLLNIAGGKFNRALIFELLRNPAVQASRKFSSGRVSVWEDWAEEFGMFRGYDAQQRKSMGDMGDAVTDDHTFKRGMEQVLKSIDDNISDETKSEAAVSYDRENAEIFLALLKELGDLSERFTENGYALDICEAVEFIKQALWLWLGRLPQDNSADSGAESRVRREIIDGLDLILLQQTQSGRTRIPLEEFIALAQNCVPPEPASQSPAWRGVTFAPLRASMIVPRRALFVLGLDATEFPGTNEKGSWDLLAQKRIVGDSDRVRDNRFAFLELLHAAKERLTLSYLARDMQKDEALQPSSVILELEEYLMNQGLVKVDGPDNSRRCSARYEIPWVAHERKSLNMAIERGRGHGTWDKTQWELAQWELADSDAPRVWHRHDLPRVRRERWQEDVNQQQNANNTLADGNQYTADLNDLKRFFKNPLEYHLFKTMRRAANGFFDDGDSVDIAAVDEPADSGNTLYALRQTIWAAVLNLMFSNNTAEGLARGAAGAAGEIYDAHIKSGQAPEGHVCRMERNELTAWAKECAAVAPKLLEYFPEHELVEKDGFSLNCEPFIVNGYHSLAIVPKDRENRALSIGLTAFDANGNSGDNYRLWLDGLTQWLREAGHENPRKINLVALNHGGVPDISVSSMKMNFEALPEIQNWLTVILRQMLVENRCEHLPFTAIADIIKPEKKKKGRDGADMSFAERLQKLTARALKEKLTGNGYKASLKAFKLADARPPELTDGELRELVSFRYAPMLERRIHE